MAKRDKTIQNLNESCERTEDIETNENKNNNNDCIVEKGTTSSTKMVEEECTTET